MRPHFFQRSGPERPSRLSSRELATLAKELSFLLKAGLPLFKCLSMLERRSHSQRTRSAVSSIKAGVSSGLSMKASLASQKDVFPEIFISAVAAGEAGGALEGALERIAAYFQTKDEFRKKVLGSLIYPGIVLALSLLSILFVAVYLVPTMEGVFSSLGVKLPALTVFIGSAGQLIIGYWYVLIAFAFLFTYFAKRRLSTEAGKARFESFLLRLPLVGGHLKRSILFRICETLSTLLSSGVPLINALSIASAIANSASYSRAISSVSRSAAGGARLSDALASSREFPELVSEMAAIGESSGRLPEIFAELANHYRLEVESGLKIAVSMVEPVSTIFVGATVGLVVFSIFLPMVNMLDAMAK
jgi:type IV pilus assembly protein PilC